MTASIGIAPIIFQHKKIPPMKKRAGISADPKVKLLNVVA